MMDMQADSNERCVQYSYEYSYEYPADCIILLFRITAHTANAAILQIDFTCITSIIRQVCFCLILFSSRSKKGIHPIGSILSYVILNATLIWCACIGSDRIVLHWIVSHWIGRYRHRDHE